MMKKNSTENRPGSFLLFSLRSADMKCPALSLKKDTFHMPPDQHSAAKHDKCHIRGMMAATTKASGASVYLES
ncbi:hypothetical protein BAGR45_19630 [Bacillus velezensis]|nr:hypothetical protein BAGR45_19630 [Bacillus velezensis]